jgi:antitoxin component YwqK of YwqJK toxin-antitoxin module
MRYYFLLIFFCLSCQSSKNIHLSSAYFVSRNGITETITNPQRLKEIEKIDFLSPTSYQKVIKTQPKDYQGKVASSAFTYYSNGCISRFLEMINGRAYGYYKEWHPNGFLKLEAYVIEGAGDLTDSAQASWVFDGKCRCWDEKGSLEAIFNYEKGSLEESSLHFFSDGQIKKQESFFKDQKHGIQEEFYSSGSLFLKSTYYKGSLNGISKGFWNNGNKQFIEYFEKGLLKKGTYFEKEGKETSSVENFKGIQTHFLDNNILEQRYIKQGLQEGFIRLYNHNKLTQEYFVKEGKKNGTETLFYNPQQPKLMIEWYQDQIQGAIKTWYPNGQIQTSRQISQNKKHGINTSWYSNGNLMLAEHYEMNVLTKGQYYSINQRLVSEIKQGSGKASLFSEEGQLIQKIIYEDGYPIE